MLTILAPLLLTAIKDFATSTFSGLFNYLTNKTNAQATVEQATLTAQVANNQTTMQWLLQTGPMIVSCTMGETAVIYFCSIILDSMFHFHWGISKLPSPWDDRAWVVLLAFLPGSIGISVASKYVSAR